MVKLIASSVSAVLRYKEKKVVSIYRKVVYIIPTPTIHSRAVVPPPITFMTSILTVLPSFRVHTWHAKSDHASSFHRGGLRAP